MASEAIANIDSYIWVAVGLFVTGLFATIVFEKFGTKKQSHSEFQSKDQK